MTSERGKEAPRPYSDEAELVKGLASLDASAWRHLFESQYPALYRYAYLRLGNRHDAEDVAASVFTEAVKGISSFRYRGIPVAAWLYRIAHHETVDALKKRRPTADLEVDVADTGASHLAQALERHDLSDALGALKQEHRDVLMLRFIEDLSVRETALALRKTEGAVKVLQLRALRTLRRRMRGTGDDV